MKEIKAVFAPQRLDALRDAMMELPGFTGMTVCKAEGYHPPHPTAGRARVRDVLADHGHRLLAFIVVPDDRVADFVTAIQGCAAPAAGSVRVWVSVVVQTSFDPA